MSIAILLLLGFAVVMLRCAWVTEDAYIMFRTIDNAIHGLGLTWNPGERVQVYTCPLWMLALWPMVALTGEFYFTTLTVQVLISLVTVWMLIRLLAPSLWAAAVAVTALTVSKGYIDFSTSGMENPLSYLVLIGFLSVYFRTFHAPTPRTLALLTILASLGLLTRLDTALIYGPALALIFWRVTPKRAATISVLVGSVPLAAWEIFSLVYYGFFVPNTAYAKLNLGIPTDALVRQGLHYFQNGWMSDPARITVLALGLVVPCLNRRVENWPIVIGIGLYLAYVLKIGGDFMSMRFLALPLLAAVVLLCRFPTLSRPAPSLTFITIIIAMSLSAPRPTLLSGVDFGTGEVSKEVDKWGIADERGFYYPHMGLLPVWRFYRQGQVPPPVLVKIERETRRQQETNKVKVWATVGISIFRDNPKVNVIDYCALGDALLSRLPAKSEPQRVGHYSRHVPTGYVETKQSGKISFADPLLGDYYQKLKLIISGPLWIRERWHAIWQMHTGQLDHLINWEHYRHTGEPPNRGPG